MSIDELYEVIYKEKGSKLVAATIVVEDQNEENIRAYSLNSYGAFECIDIK